MRTSYVLIYIEATFDYILREDYSRVALTMTQNRSKSKRFSSPVFFYIYLINTISHLLGARGFYELFSSKLREGCVSYI